MLLLVKFDFSCRIARLGGGNRVYDVSACVDNSSIRMLSESDGPVLVVDGSMSFMDEQSSIMTQIDTGEEDPTGFSTSLCSVIPFSVLRRTPTAYESPHQVHFLFSSMQATDLDTSYAVVTFRPDDPRSRKIGLVRLVADRNLCSGSYEQPITVFDQSKYKLVGQAISLNSVDSENERMIAFQTHSYIFILVSTDRSLPSGDHEITGWHIAQYNLAKNSVKQTKSGLTECLIDGVEYNGKLYFMRKVGSAYDQVDMERVVCLDPSNEYCCSILPTRDPPELVIRYGDDQPVNVSLDRCTNNLIVCSEGVLDGSLQGVFCLDLDTFVWSCIDVPVALRGLKSFLFHVVPQSTVAYVYGYEEADDAANRNHKLYKLRIGFPTLHNLALASLKSSNPQIYSQCIKDQRFEHKF